jgi:hypothetical protein
LSQCQRCSGKAQVWLCRACESDLRKELRRLSWLVDGLFEKALGQTREGSSERRSGDLTSPMPCNLSASSDLDRIHAMLVRWVQDLCETRGVIYPAAPMVPADFIGPLPEGTVRGHASNATKSAAIWLANNTGAIACDESAGMCVDEVNAAVELALKVINRPEPNYRFLGPCPSLLTDNYGERICNVELTAARADDHVQCPSCKTTHRVGELHEQQMRNTDVMSFTLSQLYRMILPINREYVPLRTLQHWVTRGKLVPTGYDADGEPRFLLADVRELRDRKPQKVATGSAAHKNKRAS